MNGFMENMKKQSVASIDMIVTVILLGIIVAMVYVFAMANIFHYTANMEADIASESLLTEVLYENGFVQPNTWCASTTLRVISVPNFAAFIYPLVGYNSNLATGITCTIFMVVMLVLLFGYLRSIGMDVKASLLALIVLCMVTNPSDESQRMVFLYASYYVSHVITMIVILNIYSRFIEKDNVKLVPVLISFAIAAVNGMQGLHACMFCYFPIIMVEGLRRVICLIRKEKQPHYLVLLWTLAINAVTLIVTKLMNANNVGTSRNIRHALEKFIHEVWPTIIGTLSFNRISVITIAVVIIAVIGYGLSLRTVLKKGIVKLWSSFCFLAGFFVCVLLTTFTTFDVAGRYYLMLVFSVAVGTSLFIHHAKKEFTYVVIGIVIIGSVISAKDFYNSLVIGDRSEESSLYVISLWMEESGYTYGYSTFDYSNPITVIKNNGVKVRAVSNMTDLEGCKWLSDSTWYPPTKNVEEETCYIVSEARRGEFNVFLDKTNPEIICTHEVDDFMIYVLDRDYTVWEK